MGARMIPRLLIRSACWITFLAWSIVDSQPKFDDLVKEETNRFKKRKWFLGNPLK